MTSARLLARRARALHERRLGKDLSRRILETTEYQWELYKSFDLYTVRAKGIADAVGPLQQEIGGLNQAKAQ